MSVLIIRKGNAQLKIDEKDKKRYLKDGYDVITVKDGKVKIVESSKPINKEIAKLQADNKKLEADIAELKKAK